MILPALVLLFFSSFALTSILRLKSVPAFLLSTYLIVFGEIVLLTEVAGLLHLLNSQFLFLSFHAVLALLSLVIWRAAGYPSLAGPLNEFWGKLKETLWHHKVLALLTLGVGVAYLVNALVILIVPPNNFDSMTCHMARVGYWLQNASFSPWPTSNTSQIVYPINAQCCTLWTILFWGTDQLAGFVQWSSALAGILAVFGLSRVLGWNRAQSLFAALIWATLPEIVLQSTTTQNHLVGSVLFATGLYFFFAGIQGKAVPPLMLSGLAFALAIGTQQLVLFLLPGVAVTAVLIWIKNRANLRLLYKWAIACAGAFVLVGAFMFIFNMVHYGNPLGPSDYVRRYAVGETDVTPIDKILSNVPRLLYQSVDFSGLPPRFAEPFYKVRDRAMAILSETLKLPVNNAATVDSVRVFTLHERPRLHEDFAWFGPIGLLLLPAGLYHFFRSLRRAEPFRLGVCLIAFGLLLGIAGFKGGWTPNQNRYFVAAATIWAPFLAPLFSYRRFASIPNAFVAVFALIVLGWSTLFNQAKPLIGSHAIWTLDRIKMQTLNSPQVDPVLRAIEAVIPEDATIGITIGPEDWDYPLFGKRFRRRVFQLLPGHSAFDSHDLDFVVAVNSACSDSKQNADYYPLVRVGIPGYCWSIMSTRSMDSIPAKTLDTLISFRSLPQKAPLVEVTNDLWGSVSVMPGLMTPPWGLEERDKHSFIWLGSGPRQGLGAILWSNGWHAVNLNLHLFPGPSRPDNQRYLELRLKNDAGEESYRRHLSGESKPSFPLNLAPGPNQVTVQALDPPTQPIAGDSRPLLMLLKNISVQAGEVQLAQRGASMFQVDSALRGVSIAPNISGPPWGVEAGGGKTQVWLGSSEAGGFSFMILSNSSQNACLLMKAVPGPARRNGKRSVEMLFQNRNEVFSEPREILSASEIEFALPLIRGGNRVGLKVLEAAETRVANDPRPLMLQLTELKISSNPTREPIRTFPIALVDFPLFGQVGLDAGLRLPKWGIDSTSTRSWVWLGQGIKEGISGNLLCSKSCSIGLRIEVAPGPARSDSQRSIELLVSSSGRERRISKQIYGPESVLFPITLAPGSNRFALQDLDIPLVKLPADARPLLLRVASIRIEPESIQLEGTDESGFLVVAPELRDRISLDPRLDLPPWGMESAGDRQWLWLGQDETGELRGTIRSSKKEMVLLEFKLLPGPCRGDQIRHISLELRNAKDSYNWLRTVEGATNPAFELPIQLGENTFRLRVLDKATLRVRGDTRPLLLRIERISLRATRKNA